MMQTPKEMIFNACAFIVHLRVLICYVNTCLQRLINRFIKKVGFECRFRSAKRVERQPRTKDNVETWVFNPLSVQ